MNAPERSQAGYVVLSYRAAEDAAWYHFLHGNVPGHQIDFMYRAEVPQGPLTRQHFSHISRLMKYIEPQAGVPYAFAIGNLSRDDTQHEPGHGGLALIFGLRIRGVTDHAGRQDPPFAHGIAAIDRELTRQELLAAAGAFHRHVLGAAESADWYRSYVRCAPAEAAGVLAGYVSGFRDLPSPEPSSLGLEWTAGATPPPRRVVIVHEDDAPFGAIAACAAKIAAMLYPSNIRWSAISNGREDDLPNGVTVRFVSETNLTASDEALGPVRIDDVPDDEAEIARALFGAASTSLVEPAAPRGWRDRYGQGAPADVNAPAGAPPRVTPVPFDAASTHVWERTGPGIEVTIEEDVAIDQSTFEASDAAVQMGPGSLREPARSSQPNEPPPRPNPARSPRWRILIVALLAAGILAALHVLYSGHVSSPAPGQTAPSNTAPPPDTAATRAAPPDTAMLAPSADEVPSATRSAAPQAPATATATSSVKSSGKLKRQILKPTPGKVFDGDLQE
jgi:hypothetical protein